MAPVLDIKNLRKEYKDFALDGISFSLEKGYIMGFIGPNGAGKSTTIKLIPNLIKKDSGEIKIFGLDNLAYETEVKNRIGFVLDEAFYYEMLTVKEMKNIIAPHYKNWDKGLFSLYIKRFELPLDKKIKDLSKGMKMKFSLAIALSHHAELLLMDEPTSGLDPVIRSELLDILSELMESEDLSIFFSTHITSDLDKIADYIVFIDNGKIVLDKAKDDILENYGIVKGPKGLIDKNDPMFIGYRENSFGFEALVEDKNRLKMFAPDKIIIEKPTLEDIMVFYTRRNGNA